MEYKELLKDPRWQRKRLEIFQRDDWTCKYCGNSEIELHAHHKEYIKDLKPWEYEDSLLITVCRICHDQMHLKIRTRKKVYFKLKRILNLPSFEELWPEKLIKLSQQFNIDQ